MALSFNGAKHPSTEAIIAKMSGVPVLGRIDQEPYFDKNVVKQYAEDLEMQLRPSEIESCKKLVTLYNEINQRDRPIFGIL